MRPTPELVDVAEPVTPTPPVGSALRAIPLGVIDATEGPVPTLGGVLYDAAVNSVFGRPGGGKSYLACAFIVEAVRAGRVAIVVDHEDVGRTWARRLRGLGLETADLDDRLQYLQPTGALTDADVHWLGRLAAELGDPLVVIDSAAEAMAAAGLDETRAPDVTAWFQQVARPLAHAGACVLLLDHVTKATDKGARWARGSGAKLAACDGAALALDTVEPFARGTSGIGELIVGKDRHGAVGPAGEVAATVHFSVLDDVVHSITVHRGERVPHGDHAGPAVISRPPAAEGVGF